MVNESKLSRSTQELYIALTFLCIAAAVLEVQKYYESKTYIFVHLILLFYVLTQIFDAKSYAQELVETLRVASIDIDNPDPNSEFVRNSVNSYHQDSGGQFAFGLIIVLASYLLFSNDYTQLERLVFSVSAVGMVYVYFFLSEKLNVISVIEKIDVKNILFFIYVLVFVPVSLLGIVYFSETIAGTTEQNIFQYSIFIILILILAYVVSSIIVSIWVKISVIFSIVVRNLCSNTKYLVNMSPSEEILKLLETLRFSFIYYSSLNVGFAVLISPLLFSASQYIDLRWLVITTLLVRHLPHCLAAAIFTSQYPKRYFYLIVKSFIPFTVFSALMSSLIILSSYALFHLLAGALLELGAYLGTSLFASGLYYFALVEVKLSTIIAYFEGVLISCVLLVFVSWLCAIWVRRDLKVFWATCIAIVSAFLLPLVFSVVNFRPLDVLLESFVTPRSVIISIAPTIVIWSFVKFSSVVVDLDSCDNCNNPIELSKARYCPHCGISLLSADGDSTLNKK